MTRRKWGLLILIGFVTTQAYQNCGQLMNFEADPLSLASSGGDLNHPSIVEPSLPTQKTVTMNRTATASLLREIFTSAATPVPNLDAILTAWVTNRSPQFGSSCNPYDSATGRDCGDIGNANLAMNQDDSTLREAFRTQVCENILGYDQGVTAVLQKIQSTVDGPDANSVGQIYELFYRAESADPAVIQALLEMDGALTAKSEPVLERWRALILQVCSSTGWQIL